MPPAAPTVSFPREEAFAKEFYLEAVRHLGDARVLHVAGRYAGAVTSAQKAAELGVKAGLVLHGALGWWEELQRTHRPLTDTENHIVLSHHAQLLGVQDASLVRLVKELEAVAPASMDRKEFRVDVQLNSEYPFFYLQRSDQGAVASHFRGPRDYFDAPQSRDHYTTARTLLGAYRELLVEVRRWKVRLPRSL
jgi:hypothetical protein